MTLLLHSVNPPPTALVELVMSLIIVGTSSALLRLHTSFEGEERISRQIMRNSTARMNLPWFQMETSNQLSRTRG